MFGIIVSGRPVVLAGTPGSAVVESSPGKYMLEVLTPGEVGIVLPQVPSLM